MPRYRALVTVLTERMAEDLTDFARAGHSCARHATLGRPVMRGGFKRKGC